MENIDVEVKLEKPAQVDSYGFKIRFYCGTAFDADTEVKVYIQNPEGDRIVRTAELEDEDRGFVVYRVNQGDFTIPGTYKFQIVQESTDFRFRTPIIQIPVFDSIQIVG